MSKIITLRTFSQLADAQLLKEKLLENGIEAMLADEYFSQLYGNAVGIRVQIFEEDLKKATIISNELENSNI